MGIPTKVPIDLVNPTPAASTDLSGYLPLNGGELTGDLLFKDSNITRGTVPETVSAFHCLDFRDSNNRRIGLIGSGYLTDKSSNVVIDAYNTTVDSGNSIGSIVIGCDSSGNVYTSAPTPATTDNSTQIATTAFVNNRIAELENKTTYLSVQGSGIDNVGLRVLNQNTSNEGGQICLMPSSSSYYETTIDLYQNQFRVFQNGAQANRMFKISFADNATVGSIGGQEIATIQTGSWTPTLSGSTTAGAFTYSYTGSGRGCYYIKFGNLVFLRAAFTYTVTTAPAGEVRINGAPFVSDSYYKSVGGGNNRYWQLIQIGYGVSYLRPQVYKSDGSGALIPTWNTNDSATTWKNTVDSNDWIIFSIWYRTSS